MLSDVIDLLACPHCGGPVELDRSEVLCDRGHTFDVARQGYVSLLCGASGGITGDSADMVEARERFFARGHYRPVMDAVAEAAAGGDRVVDVGSGTGDYLALVLDRADGSVGVGVDVSKFAARRTARAHPRAGAVVADVWRRLPVLDGAVDVALSVFSPRNAAEMHRVIAPGGKLVVVTPTDRHLGELVGPLSLIGVDENKSRRLGESLAGSFERTARTPLVYTVRLVRPEVIDLVGMGPSARHGAAERAAAVDALPEEIDVTVSVVIGVYERVDGDHAPAAR